MTGLAFAFLLMIGRLPMSLRRFAGRRLGDLARVLLKSRRKVAVRNLSLTFPDLSQQERDNILRRHFQLLGALFLDECALLGMNESQVREWIFLKEEDLHSQTGDKKKPVIFCAPHFVAAGAGGIRLSMEFGGRLLFHYKPMHNKFWDVFYRRLREKFGASGVDATAGGAMRKCARHLQQGEAMFYLPDIDPKHRKSMVFAPFMGVAAATTTAASRLSSMTGAQVRMFASFMTDRGYEVRMSEPLDNFPSKDAAEDARRINELIGELTKTDPAQYYWLHRRFKTAPEGEPDRYA